MGGRGLAWGTTAGRTSCLTEPYPQRDSSSPESIRAVMDRKDASEGAKGKVLLENPRRLYNLTMR